MLHTLYITFVNIACLPRVLTSRSSTFHLILYPVFFTPSGQRETVVLTRPETIQLLKKKIIAKLASWFSFVNYLYYFTLSLV